MILIWSRNLLRFQNLDSNQNLKVYSMPQIQSEPNNFHLPILPLTVPLETAEQN